MDFIDINSDNKDYYISFLTFKSNYKKIGVNERVIEEEYDKYANYINSFKDYLILPATKKINEVNPIINKQLIYVSFHFGPYKFLIKHLINKGVDVVLLVGNEFYNEESDYIKELYKKELSSKKSGSLVLLNTNDSKSFIKLKYLINKGYSVFTFLDNYESKNENEKKKNYDNVTFFDVELSVKNGILRISDIFKVKISLILCFINQDALNIILHEFPDTLKVQYIFDQFSKSLLKHPCQWESWLYCNNWFKNKSNNEELSLESLKDNDYELIKTNNKYFIYHFDNISFYEIEAESFKKIFKNRNATFNHI